MMWSNPVSSLESYSVPVSILQLSFSSFFNVFWIQAPLADNMIYIYSVGIRFSFLMLPFETWKFYSFFFFGYKSPLILVVFRVESSLSLLLLLSWHIKRSRNKLSWYKNYFEKKTFEFLRFLYLPKSGASLKNSIVNPLPGAEFQKNICFIDCAKAFETCGSRQTVENS